MDFSLSEEQQMLQTAVREFAHERLAPLIGQTEQTGVVSPDVLQEIAELGYCGVCTDAEFDGAGFDDVSLAIVVKEIACVDPSIAARIAFTAGPVQAVIEQFGSDEQKHSLLANLAAGKKWGTVALNETSEDEKLGVLSTIANKSGNDWILNGEKSFVISAPNADVYIVSAQTGEQWTAFWITKEQKGVYFSPIKSTLGTVSLPIAHLTCSDCKVPDSQRLGNIGDGQKIAQQVSADSQLVMAAHALGVAEGAFELGKEYASVRIQFGRPLDNFEAIRGMLADMATGIESAKLLVYQAAIHRGTAKYSRMARMIAGRVASRCAHKSNQIHGGYGYFKEYPIEHLFRDQLFDDLFWGTPTEQKRGVADLVIDD